MTFVIVTSILIFAALYVLLFAAAYFDQKLNDYVEAHSSIYPSEPIHATGEEDDWMDVYNAVR